MRSSHIHKSFEHDDISKLSFHMIWYSIDTGGPFKTGIHGLILRGSREGIQVDQPLAGHFSRSIFIA
jgi:hypothetical protein